MRLYGVILVYWNDSGGGGALALQKRRLRSVETHSVALCGGRSLGLSVTEGMEEAGLITKA